MQNKTLFLPGFPLPTLRRKPRSAARILADEKARLRQHSITQLDECFGEFIPAKHLDHTQQGSFSRRRLFSKSNTFWAFFSQVLDADGGCQEVVRKIQAFAASQSRTLPSASTSAYCQARQKLDITDLQSILSHTAQQLDSRSQQVQHSIGRRVVVADGSGLSMPDTVLNQQRWPQLVSQNPGCGFPQARLSACFDLTTGALLSHAIGNKKNHELPLFRQQWSTFREGDVFLGDKGYCSYYDLWQLQLRGVDSVITLARRKPIDSAKATRVLGPDDVLIKWPKPKWNKALSYSKDVWLSLPEQLVLRQIKVTVEAPGYRVKSFYLITTLLDSSAYSAKALADLYLQRWDVELFFRDIKTTMGMDVLRCKTPDMVTKEILMYLIAYNAIRLLMNNAGKSAHLARRQISFKASVQALRQWEPALSRQGVGSSERRRLMAELYKAITRNLLIERPGRQEPRCVKRRPKTYGLLTRHRHEMIDIAHRNRYRAKAA